MSGLVMGLVWELPIVGEFGRAEKYILLAYADHSDQNGRNIYPSIDLIAQKTGYAERAVQMATRTLEKLGYLAPDGMGPHGTNRYRVPIERTEGGAKIAPLQPASMSENAPEGIAPLTPEKMLENAPEENAPEPVVVVKSSSSSPPGESSKNVFQWYEENIGPLTPMLSEELREAEKAYPPAWIEYAFGEAVKNNKRSWKYIAAILKRIKTEGFGEKPDDNKLSARKPAAGRAGRKTDAQPGAGATDAKSIATADRINARRRARESAAGL